MRMVPGLTVLDPCDATEIEAVVHAVADHDGPVYMRLLRGQVPAVLPPAPFAIGRARPLRTGADAGIVSTGLMTESALDAADALAARGIRVGVLHVPTLKPFDADAVAAFAAGVDRVVTAENHVTMGGLGSLVAEALFDAGIAHPLRRVGLPDRFIECGAVPTLQARYGLTAEALAARIAALE